MIVIICHLVFKRRNISKAFSRKADYLDLKLYKYKLRFLISVCCKIQLFLGYNVKKKSKMTCFLLSLNTLMIGHGNSPHIGGFPPKWIADPPKLIQKHKFQIRKYRIFFKQGEAFWRFQRQ